MLTLDNMYRGTEEQYKGVVAKHCVDYAEELYNEGDETVKEEMDYQYFYDRLTMELYTIFEEDGLHVFVDEYEMLDCNKYGIAVTVPYEELGIDL